MVSLDRFDVFRAVVEAGSFTGAANVLNQARAAVSFHVKQLEAELGVTLLTRTTRRVELTEAGERFYERCLRVLAEAEEAIDDARAEHGGMQGSLRVTSTVEYALRIVAPALSEFMSAHPALRVRLETHTSQADLVRDRFDVAIRSVALSSFGICRTGAYVSTRTTCGRWRRPHCWPRTVLRESTRRRRSRACRSSGTVGCRRSRRGCCTIATGANTCIGPRRSRI